MLDLCILIEILETSLKKNGDKPVTIGHLLNIMKMVERRQETREEFLPDDFEFWK